MIFEAAFGDLDDAHLSFRAILFIRMKPRLKHINEERKRRLSDPGQIFFLHEFVFA